MKTIFETPTHSMSIADGAILGTGTPPRIRSISTRAFFRRMTITERSKMRGTTQTVRDVKEDLDRDVMVNLNDQVRQLLIDSGIFSVERVNDLMIDGEAYESREN